MFYSIISGAKEGGNFLKTKLKNELTRGEFRNEKIVFGFASEILIFIQKTNF